jgi:hypothetical protein
VVAYELLTGGRPFERLSTTAEAAAHINEPVPRASERGVGLPSSVDRVFERALAKDPEARYPTATKFVEALNVALRERDEPTSIRTALLPPHRRLDAVEPPHQRRSISVWLPLLIAALMLALVGGVAAAVFATGEESGQPASTLPQKVEPVTVTKRETRTISGETVVSTVVTTVQAPLSPAPAADDAASLQDAVRLTDASTFALRRGDWETAAGLARRAYSPLRGTYSDDFRYEAYVAYDLGSALVELGRCGQALRYLARSEDLQGRRSEINAARAECEQR